MPKASNTPRGEVKSTKSFALTPTATEMLNAMASERGVSASEFIERIARGEIPLGEEAPVNEPKTEEIEVLREEVKALEEKVNALLAVLRIVPVDPELSHHNEKTSS